MPFLQSEPEIIYIIDRSDLSNLFNISSNANENNKDKKI